MTTSLLHPPLTGSRTRERLRDPVFQSFALLRIGFTVAPILFGLDKFLDWLVDWRIYLAPQIDDLIPGNAHQAMLAIGVVEIVAGLIVAVRPKWGATGGRMGWWGVCVVWCVGGAGKSGRRSGEPAQRPALESVR